MKPALQIRQSQQLALTPQLQQAIRLLQMSTLDLHQEIDQALATNPLLERIDDPWEKNVSLLPDSSLRYTSGDTLASWEPEAAHGQEPISGHHAATDAHLSTTGHTPAVETYPADELDGVESHLWQLDGQAGTARRDDFDDGERDNARTLVQDQSLHDHLMEQLHATLCTIQQRQLLEILIGEIEDDGYLRTPLDALLADYLPPDQGISRQQMEDALHILQGFDPSGVGARSLNECLSLQLTARHEESPLPADTLALARAIIDQDFLSMLAGPKELGKLAKLLHCREHALDDAIRLIRSLNPKPGNRFSAEPPHYVTPDVFVHKTSQGWRAVLNQEVVPQLSVNQEYERLLKHQPPPSTGANRHPPIPPRQPEAFDNSHAPPVEQAAWQLTPPDAPPAPMTNGADTLNGSAWAAEATAGTGHTNLPSPDGTQAASNEDSLSRQLQEARQMVRHVQQRFDTILRVAQAIVDRQQAFFNHGAVAMRPLVLREIAEVVGLHESTVSRVTTQKYMATPFGTVVELKYFFGSHVATDTGGAASSTAICAKIQQLIKEEDSTQPLSDNHITELLGQDGIKVARRTVAKYRESLRIPPAAQRKTR
ncbi:MAG: hypothetical protein Q4D91_07690 [Lautropia sp.]|nr:hypothetical protein [Lautropia sp.]